MKKLNINSNNAFYDLAELFKNYSDLTRIKILFLLSAEEKSVNEIASSLNMNQSAISHQLRVLKSAKLIKARKDGKKIYYSLSDEHVYNILNTGIEHLEEK